MKFKIAQQDLEHALTSVGSAHDSDDSKITGHFVFRIQDGGVEVLASKERLLASFMLRSTLENDTGAQLFTVPANRLKAWTKAVGNVAVSLECEATTVKAKGPHGAIPFPSLDPSTFPFWDGRLSEADKVATVSGIRLAKALDYINKYVADSENKRPDISLLQARRGRLFATDTRAVASAKLEEEDGTLPLENCFFRLHKKDIGVISSFLNAEGNVEIYESGDMDEKDPTIRNTTHVYFKREDGLVFGASCPNAEFPDLSWEDSPNIEISFEVSAEMLKSAVAQIKAAMRKDEERLRFNWEGSELKLSSNATLSGELAVVAVGIGQNEGGDKFPAQGFKVDNTYVTHVISKFKLTDISMDVMPRGATSGMVRLHQEEGTDSYTTILLYKEKDS